jgi:Ca2+/Na+ antiporter
MLCRARSFVPALNVVAIKFNIPDDVAGATLMAAGASSPELFSSIVSLFITHSALGLGKCSTRI